MPSPKIRFTSAAATGLVLAKVGHPQRDETLELSRDVSRVAEADQETLTALFLKPFRNLGGHRFHHHASLDQHEINSCARAIFADPAQLHPKACDIARRLFAKSNHPNIKSGDLCIALIEDLDVDGSNTRALCILKAESVVPFISISNRDGDLQLHTEQGINPEKIDKGCLILDHQAEKGYHVLTFDRSGTDSRFWVRDFLGVLPVTDPSFLTRNYTKMAVGFLEEEKKKQPRKEAVADDGPPPWETPEDARDAITYFENKETFDLKEFEDEVLKTPEAKARFAEHREQVEREQGQRLEDTFEISKKDVNQAKKKVVKTIMKLDTGVEIRLKAAAVKNAEEVMEHGYDEGRKMKFIKVYFREDFAG